MNINLSLVRAIDNLIVEGNTGNAMQMGKKLGIGERCVLLNIRKMKVKLKAPISYDKDRQSYLYTSKFVLFVGNLEKINEHMEKKLAVHFIERIGKEGEHKVR